MTSPQECDTFIASTMTAPAEGHAWSECDDEPYDVEPDYEPDEPSSRWKWAFVIAASAAGALAIAVAVGLAFVALTPQQPPPPTQQRSPATSVPSFNDGTIVPFPPNQPPQNT